MTKSDTDVMEFVDKVYQNAKRNQSFELANRMLKFLNHVELEVQNVMNKIMEEQSMGQENDELKIKEGIYLQI